MPLHIVILAAGQGKRMYSTTPKVLHPVGGKAMLTRVVDTALQLNPETIHVVIGFGGELIRQALPHLQVNWVMQTEQLGTGHAVQQAVDVIPEGNEVLVLSADVPLIKASTLRDLVDLSKQSSNTQPLRLLLANVVDPTGLGRICRESSGRIYAIVEEKDATDVQRQLREIYSGICCTSVANLRRWLPKLTRHNAQGEYYLTDIIAMAAADDTPIESLQASNEIEIQGVNNRAQLQILERAWQKQCAKELMLSGVTLADASRIDIRGQLSCGTDVFIDVNNVFIGRVVIGDQSSIGPNCYLDQVEIGKNCEILANTVLENCKIGDNCNVGPFARLRPGTALAEYCKVGNFVEIKNTVFAPHSKASHLSYLGDAEIGANVNIGAGTITCNYDGANKHTTIIEDGVFIGSDTQLIAPVTIGKNATIAAGSTIIKDVPPDELTLTEAKQKTMYGWTRPKKKADK